MLIAIFYLVKYNLNTAEVQQKLKNTVEYNRRPLKNNSNDKNLI
ncbi:hypothetical protein FHR29_001450 [Sphingobacterium sp. JUb56]|nr:hypothetical protein [Sphingobacterium sp. JUb56]